MKEIKPYLRLPQGAEVQRLQHKESVKDFLARELDIGQRAYHYAACRSFLPLSCLLTLAKRYHSNLSYMSGLSDIEEAITHDTVNPRFAPCMQEEGITAYSLAKDGIMPRSSAYKMMRESQYVPRYEHIIALSMRVQRSVDYLLGLSDLPKWELLLFSGISPGHALYIDAPSLQSYALLSPDQTKVLLPDHSERSIYDPVFAFAKVTPLDYQKGESNA